MYCKICRKANGLSKESQGRNIQNTTLGWLASSRRWVSQGRRSAENSAPKNKKSAARGKTPVGKLNKRSFRPLIDRLQRPVTWPPACGFQLSTFLWDMLMEYFKLRPSNWKPTFRDIFCNRNEPKQSINTAWQIKENGKCTDVTNLISRSLHTISHFPVLLDFLVDTHCRCCDSDCVQLFNLVFHYGLEC